MRRWEVTSTNGAVSLQRLNNKPCVSGNVRSVIELVPKEVDADGHDGWRVRVEALDGQMLKLRDDLCQHRNFVDECIGQMRSDIEDRVTRLEKHVGKNNSLIMALRDRVAALEKNVRDPECKHDFVSRPTTMIGQWCCKCGVWSTKR